MYSTNEIYIMVILCNGIKDLTVPMKEQVRMFVKEQFLSDIDAKDDSIEVLFTPKYKIPCVKFSGDAAVKVNKVITKYVEGYDDDCTYIYSPFCSFGVMTEGDTLAQLKEIDSVHETIDSEEIDFQRERVDSLLSGGTWTVVE